MKNFIKNITPPVIWTFLRKIHLKNSHNKIIVGKVGIFNLLMNSEHSIIGNIERHPYYSSNLPRIAEFTQRKYKDMSVIDIGANIGDGVALIRTKISCPIVCVEGDSEYYSLLEKNLKLFNDATPLNFFLGETEEFILTDKDKKEGTLRIKGVSSISPVKNHEKIKTTTLDKLVKNNDRLFLKTKVLKIDTDGYDLKILRGAKSFIKQNKPVLFFEYDRVFFDAINDDALSIFSTLKDLGYNTILFYDNYGRFLVSSSLDQSEQIMQLVNYIIKRNGAFPYYDLGVFHKDDDDIARDIVEEEMLINNK